MGKKTNDKKKVFNGMTEKNFPQKDLSLQILSQKKKHRNIKGKMYCGKSLNFKDKERYYTDIQ